MIIQPMSTKALWGSQSSLSVLRDPENSLRIVDLVKRNKTCKILEARRDVTSLQELKEIQFSLTVE